MRLLKIAGIIAGVVLLGIWLGWLGSGGSHPDSRTSVTVPPSPAPPIAKDTGRPPDQPGTGAMGPSTRPQEAVGPVVPIPPGDLVTNWEDRVDEILTSDAPEADKARKLLELFPRVPEQGQVEVAQHLSNLVADQDYAALKQFVTNTTLPEPVLDVLVGDVLNRPNSLKLPTLLDIARDSQHPKAGEAKDILQLFLEEDYHTDWTAWQAKVDQWLKDNPD